MITLAFFLIILLLSGLLAIFDTMLFGYSFMDALKNLFISEIAAGRFIAVAANYFKNAVFTFDVKVNLRRSGIRTKSLLSDQK